MKPGQGGEVVFETGPEAEALRIMLKTGRSRKGITPRPIGAEIVLDDLLHSPRTIKALDKTDKPYQIPVDGVTAEYVFEVAEVLSHETALFRNKAKKSAEFILARRAEAISELNEAPGIGAEIKQTDQLDYQSTN